jgi:hypothetical protein
MSEVYTIYLVNQFNKTQNFWCFLAGPDDLGVYANSTASLAVKPADPGFNYFTILDRHIVAAGASNLAVELGAHIVVNAPVAAAASSVAHDAALGDMWDANYATWPPNEGPSLNLSQTKSPAGTIAIRSNAFNKAVNENNDWFSNMSFGIMSESGFIGVTWSPDPNMTRTIALRLNFYVVSGNYSSNVLANFNEFSNSSALIEVPNGFKRNKSTVTYTASGSWLVTPGEPT